MHVGEITPFCLHRGRTPSDKTQTFLQPRHETGQRTREVKEITLAAVYANPAWIVVLFWTVLDVMVVSITTEHFLALSKGSILFRALGKNVSLTHRLTSGNFDIPWSRRNMRICMA
jgi:hypothetical protein